MSVLTHRQSFSHMVSMINTRAGVRRPWLPNNTSRPAANLTTMTGARQLYASHRGAGHR